MTAVKVCGLRRPTDVEQCVTLGVELLGFNCWTGSPRYVAPATIRSLSRSLPITTEVALVFVRAEPSDLERVVDAVDVAPDRLWVQLHGDEDPRAYAHVRARIIQVLRLGAGLATPLPASSATRVLLDVHASAFGGTGERIDHADVRRALPTLPPEWFLAGGLNAANVGASLERLGPFGVDVASGVESAPGVKDHAKLRAFVAAVRSAQTRVNQAVTTREPNAMGETR